MKILYLHQYFITPKEAGGARSYYLAKQLVEDGHEVTVITSNTKNKDWKFLEVKNIDGIEVKYIKNYYDSSMGKIERIFAFFKFMIYSTYYALKEKNIDIIFASTTPLTIGIPAYFKKLFNKNAKFIFEVRDVWPDIPYEMGYIKSKLLFKILKAFENKLYKSSDKIIAISEGIKQKINTSFQDKTYVYPFGANLKLFNTHKSDEWKKSNNINCKTLYVFTGAIGFANGVEYLIEAAKILSEQNNKEIHIAIIGQGSAKKSIVSLKDEYSLSNVTIFDSVAVEELNKIYESADAGVILFGNLSESYRFTASPNKFFDYIAAGLPFFFNFGGPLKEKVEKENIGIYTDYADPNDLAKKMSHYSDNKEILQLIGKNARNIAEREYDRDVILKNMARDIVNA